jgi:hypothetical protein
MHGVYPQQVGFESWNKILFIRIRGVGFIRHGHHVNAICLYIWIVKGWAGIPTLILYFFSWQLKFIYQLSNKKRMFTESLAIFPCYFPKALAQRIWCSKTLSAIKLFRPTAHHYCLALDAFLTIALPVYCMPVAMLEQEEGVCQCGSGCFSNSFSCRNTCQWCFFIFKNHFWHQHIKTIQKVQTALNFSKKKKNLKFGEKQVQPES